MEYRKTLLLNQVDKKDKLGFAFCPWREKKCGLTKHDWEMLLQVAEELFLLDGAQCFYDLGYQSYLDELFAVNRGLSKKLNREPIRTMALNLNLMNFNRLAFHAGIRSLLCEPVFINSHAKPEDIEKMWRSYLEPRSIDPARYECKAECAWERYVQLIYKWVYSKVFVWLFTLPYKTHLRLPVSENILWTDYLNNLGPLLKVLFDTMGRKGAFRLLQFWLRRTYEAGLWPGDIEDQNLKTFSRECFENDDPENNRVYTYAEYGDSFRAAQLIRDSAGELYFPVHGLKYPGSTANEKFHQWVDEEIYNRMTLCALNAKNHPAAKIIIRACKEPSSVTDEESLRALRYLKWFSGTHFMGHWGELVGLPLVIRYLKKKFFKGVSCIPGSALRLKGKYGWQQGPDGLLAEVNWQGNEICLDIYGIIEVKSYNPSAKKIENQLKRHLERLRYHEMDVMIFDAAEGRERWVPWDTAPKGVNTRRLNVSMIRWKEPLLNIIVQPFRLSRSASKRKEDDYLKIFLPWKRLGFRGMGVGFTAWLIQNLARTLKPDDYYLGWKTKPMIGNNLLKQAMGISP